MRTLERVLTNFPMKVVFAGFESDTRTLQNHGWELSLYHEMHIDAFYLALRFKQSECLFYGKSSPIDMLHIQYATMRGDYTKEMYSSIVFNVQQFTTGNIHFQIMMNQRPRFMAFDASSPIEHHLNEKTSLKDLALFRTFDSSKELVVDPNDVNMMMDLIMKAQKPGQQRILRKREMDGRIGGMDTNSEPLKNIHLQLVS